MSVFLSLPFALWVSRHSRIDQRAREFNWRSKESQEKKIWCYQCGSLTTEPIHYEKIPYYWLFGITHEYELILYLACNFEKESFCIVSATGPLSEWEQAVFILWEMYRVVWPNCLSSLESLFFLLALAIPCYYFVLLLDFPLIPQLKIPNAIITCYQQYQNVNKSHPYHYPCL